jgi:chromosomal replication initiation ATPase DnaA
MILGSKGFIKDILKKIERDTLKKGEISHRRALGAMYGVEEILRIVSQHFRISQDEILARRVPEVKKVAIYLMKRHTGAANREIGEYMRRLSNSAVAKIYRRFKKDMEVDKNLRNKIAKVEKEMSYIKGRPH